MAQIDLKNVTIKIKDGYAGGGGWLVNRHLADPVTAPTAVSSGTGGSLAAGDYLLSYTLVGVFGETLRSNDSLTLTVGSAEEPVVTFPSLPSGAVSRKLYISTPSGNRSTEKLYASGITTTTYTMTIAAPGITNPPVSNNAGGYASGTTTMIVDGGTTELVVGDTFTLPGDPASGELTVHTISAETPTLGLTTSITFSPALGVNINDDVAITILPHSLSVKIGEGNLTYDEKRKIKYITDRGLLDTVKLDDQEPMEVKFDFVWDFLRAAQGGDPPTPEEAFKLIGNASNWISSAPDKCEVASVDIELVNTPPCSGVKDEHIILPMFRHESLNHDPKTSQISVTGKCNALMAVVTRV